MDIPSFAPPKRWSRERLARETHFLQLVASEFAKQLLPLTREVLHERTSETISREWRENAVAVLRDLLDDQQFTNAELVQQVNEEVERELRTAVAGSLLEPSDNEIWAHAVELAQCVIGNWVSILKREMQDRSLGNERRLTDLGLPETTTPDALLEGVDGFALDPAQVETEFETYLLRIDDAGVSLGRELEVRRTRSGLRAVTTVGPLSPVPVSARVGSTKCPRYKNVKISVLKKVDQLAWGGKEPVKKDRKMAVTVARCALDSPTAYHKWYETIGRKDVPIMAMEVLNELNQRPGLAKQFSAARSFGERAGAAADRPRSPDPTHTVLVSCAAAVYVGAVKEGLLSLEQIDPSFKRPAAGQSQLSKFSAYVEVTRAAVDSEQERLGKVLRSYLSAQSG